MSTDNLKQENDDIVDLSYVMDLSYGKPDFLNQVLTIFMENTPQGLLVLADFISKKTDNWDEISKQAHFLKSSFGIVNVKGMQERLQQIETLAKEKQERPQIEKLLSEMQEIFAIAEKVILRKMEEVS